MKNNIPEEVDNRLSKTDALVKIRIAELQHKITVYESKQNIFLPGLRKKKVADAVSERKKYEVLKNELEILRLTIARMKDQAILERAVSREIETARAVEAASKAFAAVEAASKATTALGVKPTEKMFAISENLLASVLRNVGGSVTVDSYEMMYTDKHKHHIVIKEFLDPAKWIVRLEEEE